MYFVPEEGKAVKAELLAVNEPRTLKVLVPAGLVEGTAYRLVIYTQSSARTSAHLLKEIREMKSDFTLMTQ